VADETPEPNDPRLGTILQDRYKIVARIAAGAMGAVYRGERLQLGRAVAIKFLHVAFLREPEFQRRFEVEARAMSRLGHPHCVSVIDFGVADVPYLVMDFVHGVTLRDLIERGPLPPGRALLIMRQVLGGLSHAHGKGVVHRDIKPANVMLTEATGTGDHVRILDFGLAKMFVPGEKSATVPMAIGTPSYMSPEQARGDTVDARSDVYSAGVLLFELLTGEKPFIAEEAFSIIRMQIEDMPPRLSEKAPDGVRFSPELEAVVARALEKRPEDRFQSAAELAEALEEVPEGKLRWPSQMGEEDPRAPTMHVFPTVARPRGARRKALAVGLVLLAGVSGLAIWAKRPSKPVAQRTNSAAPAPSPVAPVARPGGRTGESRPVATADHDADADEPSATDEVAGPDVPGPEPQAAPPPPASTGGPAPSIKDAERLVKSGQKDEAYRALIRLRKDNPKSAYVHYMLGNVQFDKLYYSDGLDSYEAAVSQNGDYRRNSFLNNNAIRALGYNKTRRAAEALIVRRIGRAALPFLDRASKTDKNKVVRDRAAAVARALRRRR
jgi:eukaryotic-like serine/threonine-protein kinase